MYNNFTKVHTKKKKKIFFVFSLPQKRFPRHWLKVLSESEDVYSFSGYRPGGPYTGSLLYTYIRGSTKEYSLSIVWSRVFGSAKGDSSNYFGHVSTSSFIFPLHHSKDINWVNDKNDLFLSFRTLKSVLLYLGLKHSFQNDEKNRERPTRKGRTLVPS